MQHYCWPTTPSIVGCYMLRPFAHPVACCCVLLRVVRQSLRPSGDLGDLVECYSFYLPFETKLKKKMELAITHQGKAISSVVYGPRHLSCEISSVGLFHNVLTGNVLVLQKKKKSHREVYRRRILILNLTVFLFLILRRQCLKWTGMLPVFTTC